MTARQPPGGTGRACHRPARGEPQTMQMEEDALQQRLLAAEQMGKARRLDPQPVGFIGARAAAITNSRLTSTGPKP
jgi:hypothetical protein